MGSDDALAQLMEMGENYPGSKRKRRAVAPTPAPVAIGWDANPVIMKVDGNFHEFFQIGALAMALGRRSGTVRDWIGAGVLPPARYIKAGDGVRGRRRLWTRAQIEGIARIATEEGIIDGSNRRPVRDTEFTARVRELFRVLGQVEP